MSRKLMLIFAFVGLLFASGAQAGRFSFGYSDYGHRGGYSLSLGGFGGGGWGGGGWGGYGWNSPGWYGPRYGLGYGYRNQWGDPWYLSGYRGGHYDCFGCGGHSRSYFPARGYYGGSYPRYSRNYSRYDRSDRYYRGRHDGYRRPSDYDRNNYREYDRR